MRDAIRFKLQAVHTEKGWHDNHNTESMILEQWDFTICSAAHHDAAEIKLGFCQNV